MNTPNWLKTPTHDVAFTKAATTPFASLTTQPGKPKIVCKGTLTGPTQATTIRLRPEDYKRLKAASDGSYTAAIAAIVMDKLDELERNHEVLTIEIKS